MKIIVSYSGKKYINIVILVFTDQYYYYSYYYSYTCFKLPCLSIN